MNTMLLTFRASLASTGTFISLLVFFFAATVLARKQQWTTNGTASCSNTVPVSIPPHCPLSGERHQIEHLQLLKRLDRQKGKWDKHHPRWELLDALNAYDTYEQTAGEEIRRFEGLYKHVPAKHKKILEQTISYPQSFPKARTAITINANICRDIVNHGLGFYNITRSELSAFAKETSKTTKSAVHRSHVSQALKHVVRDWSSEGHVEREAAFPYILDAVNANFPPPTAREGERSPTYSVLVPGAGLGSLAHEIAHLGPHIHVTSNEFSAYMNLAYRYLASFTQPSYKPLKIHPFVEPWSHARTREALFRAVTIDSSPALLGTPNTILIEGDFTALFPSHTKYDAVATLFFIDTARNIVDYLEKIYQSLKPGGTWVNVGPLLYGTAPFVQLSLEEVVRVAEAIGFVFERRGEGEVLYNFNQSTLYKHGYVAQFWVARKPEGGSVGKQGWW